MENQTSESSIKSLERIREYPVVKDTFTKAGEYYTWIKEKNSKLNSTLTWTESNLKIVKDMVEPIAASKLGSVDNFACNQLDKLETKYPIIKESSETIIKSSGEYYDSSIKPNVDKMIAAKDSAVYIAKTPFRITGQTIEFLSNTTNSFVHRFMSKDKKEEYGAVEKKEYDILYRRALKEVNTIMSFTLKNIEGLSNVLNSIYDQSVTKNKEWLHNYYEEFTDEMKKNSTDESKTELTVMQLAQNFSNKLRVSVRAMSTVCYNHMSLGNKETLDLIFNKTEHIYSALSKSTYQEIRDQISIENIKWIGQNSIGLLSNIKESLSAKYKVEVGQNPSVEEISQNDDDSTHNEEANLTDYLSTNDEHQ